MKKDFKNLDEQIKILKNRNMIISKEDKNNLLYFNYAHIIYNYSKFFLSEDKINYKKNTKLKNLIEFWKFERELMSWIMPYIYRFEHIFKSTISYIIAEIDPFAHYGEEIYNEKKYQNVLKIKREIINKEIFYIKSSNYIKNKTPIWMIINDLTFNQLIKLFECLKSEYKDEFLEKIEYKFKKSNFPRRCRIIKEFRNRESHNGIIHKAFKLKRSKNPLYLNNCILALSSILENKNIKINLAKKFYEKFKKDNYDQKINWLENVYKIKIRNELKTFENKK